MRKVYMTAVCALLFSASAASAQTTAPQKFAYVNSQRLLEVAPGAAGAQATLEKEVAGYRAQIQKMSDSMAFLTSAYQKDEGTLTATAKDARLKVLRDRQAEFQDKAQKLNDQSDARSQELMGPITDGIRKVLEDFRAENGYSFLFDSANSGFLLAVDKNLDMTDRVASRLKLAAPLKAAAPTKGPIANPAGVTTKKPPTQ